MRRTAFTLLELLLVLAIIIVIAAMGTAGFQRQYARAQFKSGVVQLQVDLQATRLLAMQSGNAYVLRYVPGSSIYEVAPLKTLQETLYRINGDSAQDDSAVLGGSLGSPLGTSATSGIASSGGVFSGAYGLGGETQYTDDLFSYDNILADLQAAQESNLHEARLGASNVDMTSGLGGGLNSTAGVNSLDSLGTTGSSAVYGSSTLSGSTALGGAAATGLGTLGTSGATIDPISGASADPTGMGSQFALDGMSTGQNLSTTIRELNVYESRLSDENTLAWRVNADGAVIRKQTKGDVVFTFMRVSESTKANLKNRRPGGVKGSETSSVTGSTEGEDLGSTLGGSLTSVPTSSSGNSLLGGSLTETPGGQDDTLDSAFSQDDSYVPASLWSEPLVFYPNGKTSNAVLGLASVGDYDFYSEIALRGMTGVARISSISSLPPGFNPGTALTREQLFRLTNPGVAYSGTNSNNAASTTGGSLGVSTPSSATSENSATSGLAPLGTDAGMTNALGGAADSAATGFTPSYGTANGGVGYGSTNRRSGYSFNTSNGAAGSMQTTGAMQSQTGPSLESTTSGGMLDQGTATGGALGTLGGGSTTALGGADATTGGVNANGVNANGVNNGASGGLSGGIGGDGAQGAQPGLSLDSTSSSTQGGALGGAETQTDAASNDKSKQNARQKTDAGGAL